MKIKKGMEPVYKGFSGQCLENPYGKDILDFTNDWADQMETDMENGICFNDSAREKKNAADKAGIPVHLQECAFAVLDLVWEYGAELWRWENSQSQRQKAGAIPAGGKK